MELSNILKKPSFLVTIGLIIFWLLYHGKKQVIWDWATAWTLGIATALWLGILTEIRWKYLTPKLVCSGFHTSTTGEPFQAGNYYVFTAGDVDAELMKWRGREGTVIVPMDSIVKVGESIVSFAHVTPTQFNELPLEVQSTIERNKLREPYYFGEVDVESLTKVIDYEKLKEHFTEKELEELGINKASKETVVTLIQRLIEERKLNTDLKNALRNKFDHIEDIEEFASRIGLIKSRSFLDIFRKKEE